jgi:hypothetical protein
VKSLSTTLPLTLALGGLVALLVFVLPLDAGDRTSAWIGTLVASLLGAVALVIKTQFSGMGLTGTAAMKALVTAQGLAFMLRLIAVGVGAVSLKQHEALSPMAFVIAFFVVSLSQQALETRSLLAGTTRKSSEVIS